MHGSPTNTEVKIVYLVLYSDRDGASVKSKEGFSHEEPRTPTQTEGKRDK